MLNQIPVCHAFEMGRLSTHSLFFGLEIKKPVSQISNIRSDIVLHY